MFRWIFRTGQYPYRQLDIVHMLNEESPLSGLSRQDMADAQAELLVFVQGFDESFSNTVVSRTSYTWEEFVFGAKFLPMYHPNETIPDQYQHRSAPGSTGRVYEEAGVARWIFLAS
jgi:hypothetical protein